MRKVRVKQYGFVHYYAQCENCDWDYGISIHEKNRNEKVRNAIRSHVKKTGHTVHLEAAKETEYYAEGDVE